MEKTCPGKKGYPPARAIFYIPYKRLLEEKSWLA